jgi:hypothetical protein
MLARHAYTQNQGSFYSPKTFYIAVIYIFINHRDDRAGRDFDKQKNISHSKIRVTYLSRCFFNGNTAR